MRRFASALVVASLVVTLTASLHADAADAVPTTDLSTGELLLDEAGGQVFVTASDTVAVFDLAGTRVGTIPGQTAAYDLMLRGRTLYVLSRTATRINTFDADTLQLTGGWDLPGVSLARGMAWSAGSIWITYGWEWGEGLARLDPSSGAVQLHVADIYGQGEITATTNPARVFVLDTAISQAHLHKFDVSGASPVLLPTNPPGSNVCPAGRDLVISSAATRMWTACGAPYEFSQYQMTNTAVPTVAYPAHSYPTAIAISGDGRIVVGGTTSSGRADVWVYDMGTPNPLKVLEIGGDLLPTMLAVDHDGTRLYAVNDAGALKVVDLRPSLSSRPGEVPDETVSHIPVTGSGLADVTSVTLDGIPVAFSVVSENQLHVTVPELPAGTYPIVLTSRWGTNEVSELAELDVVASGPAAPAAPMVTGTPPFGVSLSWVAPEATSPITGYRVRAYVGDGATPVAQRTIDGTATTTTFDGLIAETGYRFTVAAVDADGSGAFSTRSALAAAGLPDITPFDSLIALVNRQYLDVVSRTPTSTKQTMWLAALRSGEATPVDLVLALRDSEDNQENVDAVARLYLAYFGRPANTSGLTFWTAKRRSGASLASVSSSFASSSEFRRTYAALTNRGFVELVYQRVLGRPGDPRGLSYWTSQIDAGRKTRGTVMIGFSESPEYVRDQASEVTASALPTLLLGQAPTHVDYQAAIDALDAGDTTPADLVAAILTSSEYATRIADIG